jgi:hypothetical protein
MLCPHYKYRLKYIEIYVICPCCSIYIRPCCNNLQLQRENHAADVLSDISTTPNSNNLSLHAKRSRCLETIQHSGAIVCCKALINHHGPRNPAALQLVAACCHLLVT